MALIFYSSSQPDPAPALTQVVWDKGLHVGGYALLALLFARAFRREGAGWLVTTVAAIVFTSLYGASDEWSYKVADKPTYCYDIHATLLHLLGVDHTRLTYRNNGIDRRLTDVHGQVTQEILG